jgi:hypothetical protein
MTMIEEADLIVPPIAVTPEEAFLDAKTGFSLDDVLLEAYSPARKVAAQAMGMIYPMVPDEDEERFERSGQYSGIIKDMAIVLWLCSLKTVGAKGEWNPAKAVRKPEEALSVAIDFAAEKQFEEISAPNYMQAYATFIKIVTGESVTQFVLKSDLELQKDAGPLMDSTDPKV